MTIISMVTVMNNGIISAWNVLAFSIGKDAHGFVWTVRCAAIPALVHILVGCVIAKDAMVWIPANLRQVLAKMCKLLMVSGLVGTQQGCQQPMHVKCDKV